MSVGVLFFGVLVDLFCFLLFYQVWVSHSHVDLEPTISSCFSLPKVEITCRIWRSADLCGLFGREQIEGLKHARQAH